MEVTELKIEWKGTDFDGWKLYLGGAKVAFCLRSFMPLSDPTPWRFSFSLSEYKTEGDSATADEAKALMEAELVKWLKRAGIVKKAESANIN